jgi:phage shock protein E
MLADVAVEAQAAVVPSLDQALLREKVNRQDRRVATVAVVVVDVRQPEEFTAPPGHLPGAVNVPLADLSGRAGELAARREPVVLVCKTDRELASGA